MADAGGVPPPEGDEPPIVKLLEGLNEQNTLIKTQTEKLGRALGHVRRLWWAMALIVAGMLVLGVAYKVQLDRLDDLSVRNRAVGRATAVLAVTTTRSLCTFRRDLEERVANGEAFLREHPNGIPGIPGKTLRTSVGGQHRTIVALAELRCPSVIHHDHGNP